MRVSGKIGNHQDFLIYRSGGGNTIEIDDLDVNSERRTGIGRRMFEKMLSEIPYNTWMIYAITRKTNELGRKFYEGVGFKQFAILEDFYVDGDAVLYGYWLCKSEQ